VTNIADENAGAPAVVDSVDGVLQTILEAEVVELVEDVLGKVPQAPQHLQQLRQSRHYNTGANMGHSKVPLMFKKVPLITF
jgi:hypothetical protein